MALSGTEVLQVLSIQANGQPAAITTPTTTAQIAALSSGGSSSTVITPLTTVGNGTITAAGIFGKITARGGTQTAVFTDTTDTAANIIAAIPAGSQTVGTAFKYTYENNTVFPATISGGTGVTVSGVTTLPANSWAEYLVTYSAANTVTIVAIEMGFFVATGTFTANGASAVTVTNAAITANSIVSYGLKTIGGTPAGAPFMATVTPGTGFTVKAVAGDTSVYTYQIQG